MITQGRAAQARRVRLRPPECASVAGPRARSGRVPFSIRAAGSVRRQAVLDQPGAQPVERLVAHVEDQRLARLAQGLPVELGLAVLGVAGDQDQGLGVVAVGQRDDGSGGAAGGGGDARDDLERDAGLQQRLDLLAAAAEDQRVAALQPDHALARAGRAGPGVR